MRILSTYAHRLPNTFCFLFLLIFLITSCQIDDIEPTEFGKRSMSTLSWEDVPILTENLRANLGSNKDGLYSLGGDNTDIDFRIDWENITEYTDSLGNVSYTFGLIETQFDPYVFRNIVVRKFDDTSYSIPMLYTYEMSDEFRTIYNQTYSIHGFTGTVKKQFINLQFSPGHNSANIESLKGTVSDSDCPDSTTSVGTGGGGVGTGSSKDNTKTICSGEWIDYESEPCPGNEVCVQAERSVFVYDCEVVEMSKATDDMPCDDNSEVAVVHRISPMFKFPKGLNYHVLYPKLTEYLTHQLPQVSNIESIMNAIMQFTSMTRDEVISKLTWGQGPTIIVKQHDNPDYYGTFDKRTPNVIYLDVDWVLKLENSALGSDEADALSFLIGATILHEFVHWGDFNYNNDLWQRPKEEGYYFEVHSYGQVIDHTNALLVLKENNQ